MDKPEARQNGWQLLRTEYPFEHPMFRVRQDWVRWPDGVERSYTYMEARGAVFVVPVTPEGEVVLIRQFRYTVDQWSWEIPAGGCHDFEGADLADLVRRELREEVGGVPDEVRYMGKFRPGVSLIDEEFFVYLATGVRLTEEPAPEPGEQIEIHLTAPERALEMARNGEMFDGPCAYSLLLCEEELVGETADGRR